MEIVTEYPLWFSIFCLLLGGLYTFILYRKSEFRNEGKITTPLILMSIFRFISVSFLAFLLLVPLIKYLTREVEKPIIVIAQDGSESLLANADSGFMKNDYPKAMQDLESALKQDYDVITYTYGSKLDNGLNFNYTEKQTDMAAVVKEVENQYVNQNLGAVIIASDGIYNKGLNPTYQARNIKAPIYTVALGDTNIKKDIILKDVKHNKLAYLGNTFPLVIDVEGKKSNGEKTILTVSHKGKQIYTETITLDNNNFNKEIELQIDADEAGMQHFVVQLSTVSNEASTVNNRKDVYIEIIDGRQKILLLAPMPHPDIAAIKAAIEDNENYELIYVNANNYNVNSLKVFNLVICYQYITFSPTLQQKLTESNVPLLFFVGSQTPANLLERANWGIQIDGFRSGSMNDVFPAYNDNFSLFTLSDETMDMLGEFPPLKAPYGSYKSSGPMEVLANQKIGYVTSKHPLIAFNQGTERKVGWFLGEGFWRWRINDYATNENHNATNELMSKIVQYLAAKDDKRKFRVNLPKNNYFENENITFDAELYNDAYELINTPDVKMELKNEDGKEYDYVFSKTAKGYNLDAGILPVGNYSYTATTKLGDKKYDANGKFTIKPLQVEFIETVANHQLLYNLANKNNGKMVYANQLNELVDAIKAREDIRPVSYTQSNLKDLLNIKWIFFVLLALISLEWFMRKREGAY